MYYVNGLLMVDGSIVWQGGEGHPKDDKGVRIGFSVSTSGYPKPYTVLRAVKEAVERDNVPWITCGYNEWRFNLDLLRKDFDWLSGLEWFTGEIEIQPDFEVEEKPFWMGANYHGASYRGVLAFYITPELLMEVTMTKVPPEIQESLQSFKKDHPDSSKVAFIMMQFGETRAHKKIVKTIKDALNAFGIEGVRSDDKRYNDDLFPNVKTYLYGCGFGIAVFERIEEEKFNPNVSLEVGYMMALGKPVCLLKDQTLKTLHADLIGKLYDSFDPQDPEGTIPPKITKWLEDKEIIE
ncbi:hypothetical protein ES703_15017 [subsurface metagenome]